MRRFQRLSHVCTISQPWCSSLTWSNCQSFCCGSFDAELLQIFAHSGDALPVVWYLLGTWISFQIENPQICHPHKDLATRTLSAEHVRICMKMRANRLQQLLHSFEIMHPKYQNLILTFHSRSTRFNIRHAASGSTSGSQILLSWTSNVEMVVSTKWSRSSTPQHLSRRKMKRKMQT